MLIGLGVASTNRTDKFWHIGSTEEYSSKEFDGWGVRSYARVWRSCLQAVLNECYFLIPPMRRCNNLYNSALFVLWYYDVWMWYSTGIWVIWSTTVIIHFDFVDFPSRKSGRFNYKDQSIILYPPFLGPLPLVNYYDRARFYKLMLAFGPTNSPPLESNTKKEDISSTREGQTWWSFVCRVE